ncbi:MAG: hypothetical protein JWO52_1076, partial [Gammaproteobacteria bacterium]|nr:hypothetical protein [Gammaproteobacteria bacterium]
CGAGANATVLSNAAGDIPSGGFSRRNTDFRIHGHTRSFGAGGHVGSHGTHLRVDGVAISGSCSSLAARGHIGPLGANRGSASSDAWIYVVGRPRRRSNARFPTCGYFGLGTSGDAGGGPNSSSAKLSAGSYIPGLRNYGCIASLGNRRDAGDSGSNSCADHASGRVIIAPAAVTADGTVHTANGNESVCIPKERPIRRPTGARPL